MFGAQIYISKKAIAKRCEGEMVGLNFNFRVLMLQCWILTLFQQMQESIQQFFYAASEFLMNAEKAPSSGHEKSYFTSFSTSLLAMLVCQTGDKTFFLAMIMAMKYKKFIVFLGAYGALVVMTIVSAIFGKVLFSLIPKIYTDIIVTILFFYFGFKLLYEAYKTQEVEGSVNSEMKEVEQELKQMEQNLIRKSQQKLGPDALCEELSPIVKQKTIFSDRVILTQAFIMTFLAEWGDRSQIATIALAASYNLIFVTLGCLLGHCICTGAAVQLGEWISQRVSEKQVQYAGGFFFVLSGLITLVMIFQQETHNE